METLKQILTIPENHQLHLDVTLPDNFPTGPVEVLLVFSPKTIPSENKMNKELLKLAGTLKGSSGLGGEPLVIQKAMRDEWGR